MELLRQVDDARKRWDVLRHPFYVRWERGELTSSELRFYAGEYRHAVLALAHAAAAAGVPEHAREEAEHVALWDDFAAALDAPLDREPTEETRSCVQAWARDDRREALAVLYAVESAQPAISRTKLTGLVEHYGFEPGSSGTRYFSLHAERDVEHAEEARAALGAPRGVDTPRLAAAAESALRGNWLLLDGVERAG
jgi:pyrroloquinoline-quinone synthase